MQQYFLTIPEFLWSFLDSFRGTKRTRRMLYVLSYPPSHSTPFIILFCTFLQSRFDLSSSTVVAPVPQLALRCQINAKHRALLSLWASALHRLFASVFIQHFSLAGWHHHPSPPQDTHIHTASAPHFSTVVESPRTICSLQERLIDAPAV